MTLATAHLYNGGGNPLLSLPLSHGGVGPGEVCPFLQPLTPPPHSQGTRRAPHSPATQRRGRGGRGQVRSGPHPGCRRGVYCSSRTQVRRQEVLLRVLERGWRLEPPIGSGRGRSAFPATGRDEWLPDATGWGRGQTGCPASAPPHRLRGGTGDAETWVLPAPPPPPRFEQSLPQASSCRKGEPGCNGPSPTRGDGLQSRRGPGSTWTPRRSPWGADSGAGFRGSRPARPPGPGQRGRAAVLGAARAHSPAALPSHSRRSRRPARSEVRPNRRGAGAGFSAQAPRPHFPKARGRDFLARADAGPARPARRAPPRVRPAPRPTRPLPIAPRAGARRLRPHRADDGASGPPGRPSWYCGSWGCGRAPAPLGRAGPALPLRGGVGWGLWGGRPHRLLAPLEGEAPWKDLSPVVSPGLALASLALGVLTCEIGLRARCHRAVGGFPRKGVPGLRCQ